MNISDAIQILRKHNISGASVLRMTEGKVTEHELLEQILNVCDQFVAEREGYKLLLKAAMEDLRLMRKCQCCKHQITGYADICYGCHFNTNKWEWRYVDEVLKLIES